eukprot:3207699-Rhodomonas_salina.1
MSLARDLRQGVRSWTRVVAVARRRRCGRTRSSHASWRPLGVPGRKSLDRLERRRGEDRVAWKQHYIAIAMGETRGLVRV